MKHALRNEVALELAELLDGTWHCVQHTQKAAAELRRLHSLNVELVEISERLLNHSTDEFLTEAGLKMLMRQALEKAKQ